MNRSAGQELELDAILLDSLAKRHDFAALAPAGRVEEIAVADERNDSETPAESRSSSQALVRAICLVLIAVALSGLLILSRHVAAQRAYDEVAFNDILGALKALDAVGDGVTLDLTIRGPGAVPGLPGAVVSEGSTLRIRSFGHGRTYVRGANDRGSLTYRFHAGSLYAAEE